MSDKFTLIAAEKADPRSPFGVRMMCAALAVSASGFYEWLTAPVSARARRRERVAAQVQIAFTRGRGTYGVRRVHRELGRHADPTVATTSVKLVRSLMRELDLQAAKPTHFPLKPTKSLSGESAPHHQHRHLGAVPGRPDRARFDAQRPGRATSGRQHARPDHRSTGSADPAFRPAAA